MDKTRDILFEAFAQLKAESTSDTHKKREALPKQKQRLTESLASENPNYGMSLDDFLSNCFMQGW